MNAATKVRILQISTCLSASGNKLEYHLGCSKDDPGILFRIYASSGTGYYCKSWVSLNSIQQVSSNIPIELPVTSSQLLGSLFKGMSINTAAYLMSVLKEEGLVQPVAGIAGQYLRTDGEAFFGKVKALIESEVDLPIPVPKPKQRKSQSKGKES